MDFVLLNFASSGTINQNPESQLHGHTSTEKKSRAILQKQFIKNSLT